MNQIEERKWGQIRFHYPHSPNPKGLNFIEKKHKPNSGNEKNSPSNGQETTKPERSKERWNQKGEGRESIEEIVVESR